MHIVIDIDEQREAASIVSVSGTGKAGPETHLDDASSPSARKPSPLLNYIALGAWLSLGLLMALWLSAGIVSGGLFRYADNPQARVLTMISLGGIATAFYLLGRRKVLPNKPLRRWQAISMIFLSVVLLLLFLAAGTS